MWWVSLRVDTIFNIILPLGSHSGYRTLGELTVSGAIISIVEENDNGSRKSNTSRLRYEISPTAHSYSSTNFWPEKHYSLLEWYSLSFRIASLVFLHVGVHLSTYFGRKSLSCVSYSIRTSHLFPLIHSSYFQNPTPRGTFVLCGAPHQDLPRSPYAREIEGFNHPNIPWLPHFWMYRMPPSSSMLPCWTSPKTSTVQSMINAPPGRSQSFSYHSDMGDTEFEGRGNRI